MSEEIDLKKLLDSCKELGKKNVKEIMSTSVTTLKENGSFIKFAANIELHHYLAFPVVNDENEIVGIVSQTDLLKLVLVTGVAGKRMLIEEESFLAGTSIKAIMHTPAVTITPEDTIDKAAKIMFEHGIQSIPVVENKQITGIISRRDIIFEIIRTIWEK
ncbi:MAG: CBS domain-containing protein [bacterium]